MTRVSPGKLVRGGVVTCLLFLGAVLGGKASARADALEGCWEGTWHGCTDGRTGTVKATITRCGNEYHCKFRGICFGIFPYWYKSTLTGCTDPETGCVHFKVKQRIPVWGWYWMNGCTDGCKFFARYHTDDHVGYFVMRRVPCCK